MAKDMAKAMEMAEIFNWAHAVSSGEVAMVKSFIDQGRNVDTAGPDGWIR